MEREGIWKSLEWRTRGNGLWCPGSDGHGSAVHLCFSVATFVSKRWVGFNQLGWVGRCWVMVFKLGRGRWGHIKGKGEVEIKSEGKGSWVAGGMWGDWSQS